ncbi:MAG: hypothetical protein DRP22_01375 [Verrucomicrobia bacterium]|nr:MAG: hypothetical protein DRP22_01375 [Verrucomicrobiota bacterium]
MKRLVLAVIVAAAALALFCYAQTNQVLSRNAVGYVQVSVPSGGYALVSLNFESLDGSDLTIADVVGDQLPVGSYAHIWDRNSKVYQSELRTRGGWSPGTNVITRGVGFWLEVPSSAATASEHIVYVMGEVPDSFNQGATTTISNVQGLDALAYPFPSAVVWTNTALASNALVGDYLHVWNVTSQSYNSYLKTRGGWTTPDNFTIEPGQSFWFETSGTQDWTEIKPYTWPE